MAAMSKLPIVRLSSMRVTFRPSRSAAGKSVLAHPALPCTGIEAQRTGSSCMAHADRIEQDAPPVATALSLAALVLLGTRFVQGFIFWGGASRRLIYDFHEVAGVDHAVKLDFDLPGYVAAKLTHALPGALWVQSPIEWTLGHHDLIVTSVWLWTIRRTRRRPRTDVRLGDAALSLRQHLAQRRADADLRLDGVDLPRRMDDGGLRCRHEQRAVSRRQRHILAR